MIKKICFAIRRVILFPIRKLEYLHFGTKSDVYGEFLITGKKYISIGKFTTIRPYARIEAISKYNGKEFIPNLNISNNVTIEQGVHITCSNSVEIGEGTTISSYVYISDTEHGINQVGTNILCQDLTRKTVKIGNHSFLGTGVKVLPGVQIGNNVIIGANAVVKDNIPDNCMAVGVPAKVIKQFDFEKMLWCKIEDFNT